ncbi:MAG TPA: polysaccharide deacetylase family protein [Bacillota bacterium]|nr:polysaccharide deacetylase family protein [Bacillota bacterium]
MINIIKKYGILAICLAFLIISFYVPSQLHAAKYVAANDVTNSARDMNIPILCYHRVIPNPTSPYDLTPEQLEAHIQYFKANGYTPITVSQFLEYRKKPALFPEKPLIMTFDDGSQSHYTYMLPIMKKYGLKATFFIFPNAMGGSKERWLQWDEVLEISRAGMDIGSHALTHPYLTVRKQNGKQMDEAQYQVWLEKEVTQSKKLLEEKLNIPIKSLAYPFGLYNSQVETAAIKAGYSMLLNINQGLNRPQDNPYRLKRRIMTHSMSLKSLEAFFAEKVLDLEIISPADGALVSAVPTIRFRVRSPFIDTVRLEISQYQPTLKPDSNGIYTYEIPGKLRSGFQTITVRASDPGHNSYVNSWSLYYRPD